MESNCSGSKDGKYELLTAINDAIAEEIKDLMTKSKQKKILGLQNWKTLGLSRSCRNALCFHHMNFNMLKVDEFIRLDTSGLCLSIIGQR